MNWIREKLKKGNLMAGTFLALGSGAIAEIACRAGLDWILIDTEHGLGDFRSLADQIQAARLLCVAPIVRILSNEPAYFKQALDLGASGIMVPQIRNAQEAIRAIQAMRYPPDGIRGLTRTSRASNFGDDIDAYLAEANQHLLTVIQIETKASIDNIEQIASVDGVDVLFIGPSDLSCNLGISCDLQHPDMQACMKKVNQSAQRYHKQTGILIKDASQIPALVSAGFRLIALETDLSILKKGMKDVAKAFKEYR